MTNAELRQVADMIDEKIAAVELRMLGRDARIDQLETHLHNLVMLIYRLAVATGHEDMEAL